MTTEERIVQSAAEGVSPRELAAEHGMSEEAVTAVLDREADVWFTGEHLRRELLLEVSRLTRLEEHYYAKALGDGEGAAAAGGLYVKLAERKATLVGMNATPMSASVIIHQSTVEQRQNSTERIFELISRIRALPKDQPEPEEGLVSGETDPLNP